MTIGFKVVVKAIDMSVNSFSVLIFFMMILVVVSASLMYMAEGTEPPHPMQARPDLFRSIPDCMWWSVVTMTTVGYGDATPASPGGKVVAAFTMITGLLAIALPVSVLGQNFARVMDVYEDELRLNKGEDEDNDGVFSKDELRTFLFKKRAEGLLTRQFRVTTDDMMDRYDEDGKGARGPGAPPAWPRPTGASSCRARRWRSAGGIPLPLGSRRAPTLTQPESYHRLPDEPRVQKAVRGHPELARPVAAARAAGGAQANRPGLRAAPPPTVEKAAPRSRSQHPASLHGCAQGPARAARPSPTARPFLRRDHAPARRWTSGWRG